MAVGAKEVKALREATGLPMMECKRALEESGGDFDGAKEIMRKRGLKVAEKKAGRETREGFIGSYVHHDGKIGVLVEIVCETDFVARNEEFRQFAKEVCMHIACYRPACVAREELDPELVAKEREVVMASLGRIPEAKRAQAAEGTLAKTLYAQKVLLDQPFARDETRTVGEVLKDLIARIRENMVIRRFVRMELGE
jgi:elongation factor Ts